MTRSSLSTLHAAHTGKVSDKWASYLFFYDRLLLEFRDQPLRMLEIGVQNGGTLEIWAKYFERAEVIVGCDIDPRCGRLEFQDPRIHVVVGDAGSAETSQRIFQTAPTFDLIIDDGSHRSSDVLKAFLLYFPALRPGGTFVVEDTHALYWRSHQGGLLNENNALTFFKKLTDVLNIEFWGQRDARLGSWLATFFPDGRVPAFIADGWVESIEFRNSLIIVRKAQNAGNEKLGKQCIVGTERLRP